LRDKRLVGLSANAMVAGSKYRGAFEERVQQVLQEVCARQDQLVLFIDEVRTPSLARAKEAAKAGSTSLTCLR
jgi:ATP-dependent Clp protease ATP-binding subunit ClpC